MPKTKKYVAVVWYAEHIKDNHYTKTTWGSAARTSAKRAAIAAWKNMAKTTWEDVSPELFDRDLRLEERDGVTLIFEDDEYCGSSCGPEFPIGVVREQ
jgi:hypothetical protein